MQQETLMLIAADSRRRWKNYVTFMVICIGILVVSVLYMALARIPSYWALVPLLVTPYFLVSGLRGWKCVQQCVAFCDGEKMVSVSWWGHVSRIALNKSVSVRRRRDLLVFTDRWMDRRVGYLGGATTEDREAFVDKLVSRLRSEHPNVQIKGHLTRKRQQKHVRS